VGAAQEQPARVGRVQRVIARVDVAPGPFLPARVRLQDVTYETALLMLEVCPLADAPPLESAPWSWPV
jgi:hypothetical protein